MASSARNTNFFELFADSDSEAEFEGFEHDETEAARNACTGDLGVFEIPDLDVDEDVPRDVNVGWTRQNLDPLALPFFGEDDTGLSANIDRTTLQTPMDYWNLFIKDQDFESWAEQTNVYAQQQLQRRAGVLSPTARMQGWMPTCRDKVKQFIGLVLGTGLVDKPLLDDYWSTDAITYTPLFGSTMPRDRFFNILSNFHLNDNINYVPRGGENFDPLFKVRPLYDVTRRRFLDVYTPFQFISVDEGMVPWKGRLSFRQYLPNKPDKFGMKLYILCDSTNGYMSLFDVYTGADYEPNPDRDEFEDLEGHTFQVVMGLLRRASVLGKGYMLFVDNYYTSPTLFDALFAEDTMAVGTARLNRREMPKALKETKLTRGQAVFRQRENLTAVKWRDKRDVTILSTVNKATFTLTNRVNRTTGELVTLPTAIVLYNKYMGGVDRCDQLNKYYTITRKTIKWWKKLATSST